MFIVISNQSYGILVDDDFRFADTVFADYDSTIGLKLSFGTKYSWVIV